MLAYTIGIIILFPVPIKLVTDLIVHSRSSQVAQCHVFIAFTTLSPPPLGKGMSWCHATDKQQTTGFLGKMEITRCTATITILTLTAAKSRKLVKAHLQITKRSLSSKRSMKFFSQPVYDMGRQYFGYWCCASIGFSSSILAKVLFPSAMVSSAYIDQSYLEHSVVVYKNSNSIFLSLTW